MPLHYQPFNLYTYLLINLVSIPRFGPLFISINLEVFVLLSESLFLQLSLLCHQWNGDYFCYSEGFVFTGSELAGVNIHYFNNNRSSTIQLLSRRQYQLFTYRVNINYLYFNSFNTLYIFRFTTSNNKKIFISLLNKLLHKYQQDNNYQLFIIHFSKYILINSHIHYINITYFSIYQIHSMNYIKLF